MKCLAERLLGVRDHDAVPCRRRRASSAVSRLADRDRAPSAVDVDASWRAIASGAPLGLRRRPHGQVALVRFAYCEQDRDGGQEREEGRPAHRGDPPPRAARRLRSRYRAANRTPGRSGPPRPGSVAVSVHQRMPSPRSGSWRSAASRRSTGRRRQPVAGRRHANRPRHAPMPQAAATGGSGSRARCRPCRRRHGTTNDVSGTAKWSPRTPRPRRAWPPPRRRSRPPTSGDEPHGDRRPAP